MFMLCEMIQIFGTFNYFLGVAGGRIAAAIQSAGAAGLSVASQAGIGSVAGAFAGWIKWKRP